jgi:hypothetical protein
MDDCGDGVATEDQDTLCMVLMPSVLHFTEGRRLIAGMVSGRLIYGEAGDQDETGIFSAAL